MLPSEYVPSEHLGVAWSGRQAPAALGLAGAASAASAARLVVFLPAAAAAAGAATALRFGAISTRLSLCHELRKFGGAVRADVSVPGALRGTKRSWKRSDPRDQENLKVGNPTFSVPTPL